MNKTTLGCYLIVKNEEKNIKSCLINLLSICDEILVVDTGSTDKTVDIIKNFKNVKLDYFEWVNDFSKARNYAMSKMVSDYIFSIDADELLSNNLIHRLKALKNANFNGFSSINMYIELDGNRMYLGGRQIVKNSVENLWKYSVHEKLYYDESNDLTLSPYEYIIHRPHESKSHYNKYAEIYYNEINKGDILKEYNTAHYFYYLFFTLNGIDKYMAKKYLYNCFDIKQIKSNTENQGFNLWDCNWIDDDDYYLCTLIGGYKNYKMVLPYYKKLTTDLSKLLCLSWCYDNGATLKESEFIDLSYLAYHHGLFNDFIKYTNEIIKIYPNSTIGNSNIDFIKNTLSKLDDYNIIIDCTDGLECLPSTINLMSQYCKKGYILCNENLEKYELLNFEPINNIIDNGKKNLFIKANVQHDRIYIKNIMQKICYNNEPKEDKIFIK